MTVSLARNQALESQIANIRASEGSGTTTLLSTDNIHQVFNLSAARTVVLPSTGISKGQILRLENIGAFDLTIQSSDTTTLTASNVASGSNGDPTIQVGYVELQAQQSSPTAASHWRILQVYEEYKTITGTTSNAVSVAFTLKARRINRIVYCIVASATASASATTSIALAHTLPARFFSTAATEAYYVGTQVISTNRVCGLVAIDATNMVFQKFDISNFSGTSGISTSNSSGNYSGVSWTIST